MSAQASIRDVLYEEPGPKARRRILVATVVAAVALAVLLALVVRRFYVTGQLAPKFWAFFARPTTWAFLFQGFLGTMEVSLTAGLIAIALGFVLMLGRVSGSRILGGLCRVVINFFRGVPSLLLIYFFFMVVPQYGVRMPSFWMITLPVGLAASGVLRRSSARASMPCPRGSPRPRTRWACAG